MNRDETAKVLAEILGGLLQCEVDPTDQDALLIEHYGADSMDVVDIVETIERQFSVKISNDQIAEVKTFGDALKLIPSTP